MYDPYADHIAKCKAPKDATRVKNLIQCFISGAGRGWSSSQIAARLNELKIKTLVGKTFTAENVSMCILKMARFDHDSSLAHMLATMLRSGEVTEAELALLRSRTRSFDAESLVR